jgi:hypothetical protein
MTDAHYLNKPYCPKSGTGALFFSFNNGLIDYTALTKYATYLVHKNLGLPVCVVTDDPSESFGANKVVRIPRDESSTLRFFKDFGREAPWYNMGRERALDLTPWVHTIVLDVDYLVFTKELLKYKDLPLGLARHTHFLGREDTRNEQYQTMPMSHLPMYWATVIIFDSTDISAQIFFERMKKIKQNWPYFSQMAGIDANLYRNDYVATLSLSMLQSNMWSRDYDLSLAWVTAGFDCEVKTLTEDNGLLVKAPSVNGTIKDHDIHVFNKKSLLESLRSRQWDQEKA